MIQPFILSTAGHVDHGKSSLVEWLTGVHPDRLPEEKARGITIDLGFAHLELPAPTGNPHGARRYSCGIIDVPGHEDLIRNMVAGVGATDLALLVIAADDGWMPQTEEHLQILLYLGVRRTVVALTKADLVTDIVRVTEDIRARLQDTPLADAPIVPTSVVTAQGREELQRQLASTLADLPVPADIGKPRLWVDRAFSLKGVGTVVTGTLTGGSLVRNDTVVIQPSAFTTRLRSCQSFGRDVDTLLPGARAALNLPDLVVGAGGPHVVHRGHVITGPGLGVASRLLDVLLERSPRSPRPGLYTLPPLRHLATVRLHLGTTHTPARVLLLESAVLRSGERQLARLALEQPLFAFAGDRFVIRDGSARFTLAGGLVLDPNPRAARARAPSRLAHLRTCTVPDSGPEPFLRLHLDQDTPRPRDAWLVQSRFSSAEIARHIDQLVARCEAIRAGSTLISRGRWNVWREAAAHAIDTHHRSHPDQAGLPLGDLRSRLKMASDAAETFDSLLQDLARADFVIESSIIRRAGHHPNLPPGIQELVQPLRHILSAHPLDPPGLTELAPDAPHRQALRSLIESGAAVELGAGIVLAAEAYAYARTRVRNFLRAHRQATTSELRQMLGSTRRVVMPLLERLDREGLTLRIGDHRRLR